MNIYFGMCAAVVSYWSCSLMSALCAIIIVVNNAATVTDLIIGCQRVLSAGSLMLIVKCCRPPAQEEG